MRATNGMLFSTRVCTVMQAGTATNGIQLVPYLSNPYFQVYDSAGVGRYVQPSITLADAGPHTYIGCSNDGDLTLVIDSTVYSSMGGTGTGVMSEIPSTFVFQSVCDGTTETFDFNSTGSYLDFEP
jgi:hypothetical protein